jgi:ribonuclease Y
MTIAIIVLAVLLFVAGLGALAAPRLRHNRTAPEAPRRAMSLSDATNEGATLVADARAAALRAREAALEELTARRAAVESREGLIAERDRHLQERRDVFNERRFAHKKRREEIEARQAAVAAAREEIGQTLVRTASLEHDGAVSMVLERLDTELLSEYPSRVEQAVAEHIGDVDAVAANRISEAIQRQDTSNVDSAPRMSPLSLERLDAHARERLLSALALIAEDTGTELGVDEEKAQATLRGVDPIGREIARQAAVEVVDRHLQANDVPPLLQKTRKTTSRRVVELGERALWQMQMDGRPELAELVGTLHYRFSYGQNALLHCQETGYLCSILAAELGLAHATARDAGMLHDIGKAVDHDVEGVHAIIGGELLTVLGADPAIVHAVKAHHFDEEPSTDLAMLTICADAISASRPGARRDTLAAYLARLEQLQTIATRHQGVDRAFPLQAGREVRIFVKASQIKDADMPPLSAEIAREIEAEMQYPGVVKVTVIRETTATATAPAQITPVRRGSAAAVAERHEEPAETDGAAREEPPAETDGAAAEEPPAEN